MTKGRATTFEERIAIVLYCLANGKDYDKTASHFKVSYQQVYGWVKNDMAVRTLYWTAEAVRRRLKS
jgi:transposase-like protein